MRRTILSLCSGTGAWEQPFVDDPTYEVIPVDIENGQDVRTYTPPPGEVFGILAAPPCTAFSGSGARWWKEHESSGVLAEGISVVLGCLRIISECQPRWWALENPVGRLPNMVPQLGSWNFAFHPYEYAGWHPTDPASEGYSKRTCIWLGGMARQPNRKPVPNFLGSALWRIGPDGVDGVPRWKLRSATPRGFALAWKAMIESELLHPTAMMQLRMEV
jgi:hypothetical protein